jgi:hypothetical protein
MSGAEPRARLSAETLTAVLRTAFNSDYSSFCLK